MIDSMSMELQYIGPPGVHEQHLYTYHVVYNESYRVPMLFLQGRLQGSCLRSLVMDCLGFSFCACTLILKGKFYSCYYGLSLKTLLYTPHMHNDQRKHEAG